jgi:hypothetical protein
MRIRGEVKDQWLVIRNMRFEFHPFWGYEDIGAFLLLAVLLGLILRLLVRFHFLSRSAMDSPGTGLQSAVIAVLSGGLYFSLRLRYRQPVLKPLGWVVPQMRYIVIALIIGVIFCGWHCTISAASEPGHAADSNQRVAHPGARTWPNS